MGYQESVRQGIEAPQQNMFGGALQGLAGSLMQGTARRDDNTKMLANYITAMAQQGRTPISGQPAWMQGTEFSEAPIDYAAALKAQELSDNQRLNPEQRLAAKFAPTVGEAASYGELGPLREYFKLNKIPVDLPISEKDLPPSPLVMNKKKKAQKVLDSNNKRDLDTLTKYLEAAGGDERIADAMLKRDNYIVK
jgi:hypothetical protein